MTTEGKEKSRQNAVKHGLCASVVVPEDAETVTGRYHDLFWDLKPQTHLQRYYTDQIALLSVRIDRANRIERRLRDKVALRAMTSWDDDRRAEAERIGMDLAERSAHVVAELRRTPQGCDWLIERWAMLAHAAGSSHGWDEGRRRMAFDLLGTPEEFRLGDPGASVDPEGRPLDDGSDHAAVARGRIARLVEDREVASDHDDVDRALAEADLADAPTEEIRRLRRYESALHHRLRWFMARFQDPIHDRRIPQHLRDDHQSVPGAQGQSFDWARIENEAKASARNEAKSPEVAPNEPVTEPAEAEAPPEMTLPARFPALSEDRAVRREARILQAEARRDAKKRKLDRRRA